MVMIYGVLIFKVYTESPSFPPMSVILNEP